MRAITADSTVRRVLGAVLFAAGLALVGYGASVHLSVATRVGAGRCDGCAPAHPLFVVAPLAVGAPLIAAAVLSRR